MRNMSTAFLEPANTPTTFRKCDHSQATPMPGSPSSSGPVGSIPHISTPVAPCKLVLPHSCRAEDCMPGSSLTPTNSDSTIIYTITNDANPTPGQNPSVVSAHTPVQSQKANQLQQQSSDQSMLTKHCSTSHSFINLSRLHDTFRYPGDPTPKKLSSHHDGENSVKAPRLTELVKGSKWEETSPVICIEESPPNTQGVELNDAKGSGDLSTKAADHQLVVAKHTSQENVSKTPDLRPGPVDSGRAESPVLFDTPGCVGGPQSIAAKLSNIVNSNKQPTSDHSDSKADFDDDRTPPISPDDSATDDAELINKQKGTNEVDDQTFAQQKDEKNLGADSSCNEMTADSLSPEKKSSSRRQHKRSSALGQPRTRRVNTRMATRKSTAENSACGRSTMKTLGTIYKSVENDEDDFLPYRRTPRKQATVAEPMDVQVQS